MRNPAPPVLYSFRRCPYAIRARLALKCAALKVEIREVVLRDKPAQLLACSAKATVPVLQFDDGTVIDQSLDIMKWALAIRDPQGWLDLADTPACQTLIETNDGPFKHWLDRYKYPERYPDEPAAAYRSRAVDLLLTPMDARLHTTRCLLADTPSLADMAIPPFVRQFAQVDHEWFTQSGLSALQRWLNEGVESALFASVMGKLVPWKEGDSPLWL